VRFAIKLNGNASKVIDQPQVEEWLKDLALFDIITSRMEQMAMGTAVLWQLTSFGKKVLAQIGNSEGSHTQQND
jgi:hypothetical protein